MSKNEEPTDDLEPEFEARLLDYDQARRDGLPARSSFAGQAADTDPRALAGALDAIDLLWAAWQPPPADATGGPQADETRGDREGVDDVDRPSRQVLGDFRLIRELGRGGMGVVYLAEQISLRREVALKLLPQTHLLQQHQLLRFQNEARAVARLEHRHIVAVHAVGEDAGVHFFAMQYIDGCSLADVVDHIRSNRDQPHDASRVLDASADEFCDPSSFARLWKANRPDYFRQVVRLVAQAANALHHAHEQDVIHRDVKPANLLLDQHGSLLVADFGLARVEADITMTQTGDMLGTLQYMSPEQAMSSTLVDRRTDVYGVAASLYELLTLQPLFAAAERYELHRHVVEREPPRPRQHDILIPADLETIVLKGLAKQPTERYESTGDLADDLERFLENRPILARRPSLSKRLGKFAMRHRVAAVTGTAVLLAVFATIAGLAVAFNRTLASQNRELQEKVYAADMRVAFDAWKNSQYDLLAEILARYEPTEAGDDLRTFAWHFLRRRQTQPMWSTQAHVGNAWELDFSPDGKTLVTCGEDGNVVLLDAATGATLDAVTANSHADAVSGVQFIADTSIVTAGSEGRLAVSSVALGEPAARFINVTDCALTSLAVSPDRQLAMAGDESGRVHVVELPSLTITAVLEEHTDEVGAIAFSRDGQKFATGSNDELVLVWDLSQRQVLARLPYRHLENKISGIVFGDDDKQLITSAHKHRSILFWDIATENAIREHASEVGDVLLDLEQAADDAFTVTASKRGVGTLFPTGLDWGETYMREFYAHECSMHAVSIDPSSSRIAAALSTGYVAVWDAEELSSQRQVFATPQGYSDAAISPDGRWLAAADANSQVDIWNARSGEFEFSFRVCSQDLERHWPRLAFSGDGQYVALAGIKLINVEVWDVAARQRVAVLPVTSTFNSAFSPNRAWIATTTADSVQIWDLPAGKLIHEIQTEIPSQDVAFSPDGQWLVARVSVRNLAVFDVTTWKKEFEITSDLGYTRWEFAANGDQLIIAHERGDCSVWDVRQRKHLRSAIGHTAYVWSIAADQYGQTLASVAVDHTLRITDLRTCQQVADFGALDATGVAISPDGGLLAYVSKDHRGDVSKLRILSAAPIDRSPVRFEQPSEKALAYHAVPATRFYDVGESVETDGRGNVYLAGRLGTGHGDTYQERGDDAYLSKYDADGNLRWTARLGGATSFESGKSLSVSGTGIHYVAGMATYRVAASSVNRDGFLAKYNDTGALLWRRRFGSDQSEFTDAVVTDDAGDVYVAGGTEGGLDGHTSASARADAFLIKYDADGNKLWTRQMGSNARDLCTDMTIDNAGNVLLAGFTWGDFAGPNPGPGKDDVFLLKYDSAGNQLWARQFGTAEIDVAQSVALDGHGNAFVTGRTAGGLAEKNAGGNDVFLSKHDVHGTRVWTRQLGSGDDEEGWSVATDPQGSAYITGGTDGDLFGSAGGRDVFVCKYDAHGELVWGKQLGTMTDNEAFGIATDNAGHIYVTGRTKSPAGGSTSEQFDPFLIRLNASDGEKASEILPME